MKKLLCVIAAAAVLAGCGNTAEAPDSSGTQSAPAELLVWCEEADTADFERRAEAFKEQNPDREYQITVQAESLDTVCETVLADPSSAADLFAYPEDQALLLMEAGAIPHREDGIYGVPLRDGVLIGMNAACACPEDAEKLAEFLAGRNE